MRLRALVALVNPLARLADRLLTALAPSKPPRGRHPSEPRIPTPDDTLARYAEQLAYMAPIERRLARNDKEVER